MHRGATRSDQRRRGTPAWNILADKPLYLLSFTASEPSQFSRFAAPGKATRKAFRL
jgi:hypothetical protein